MGITHEFDIFITNDDIAVKNVELIKGDNYGCSIDFKVSSEKRIDMILVLQPDWSETSPKKINVMLNGSEVDTDIIISTLYKVVYSFSFSIDSNSTLNIYSDNSPSFISKYPYICIDIDRKRYSVVNRGYTYVYVNSPIDSRDRRLFTVKSSYYTDFTDDSCDSCLSTSDSDD
ncbi:host range virulence factor [Brazilian porcupinepox virus 1]|nr:host range virulence factor [Brazilian porcupinepox virus 1]